MKQQDPAVSLSSGLVHHLQRKGMTLKTVGEMIGVSESFISRVANGHRSFTLEHLAEFERKLGEPLPILLLEVTCRNSVPADKKEMFEEAMQLLRSSARLREGLSATSAAQDQDETHPGQSDPKRVRGRRQRRARVGVK